LREGPLEGLEKDLEGAERLILRLGADGADLDPKLMLGFIDRLGSLRTRRLDRELEVPLSDEDRVIPPEDGCFPE
jgi:hypothetical protein